MNLLRHPLSTIALSLIIVAAACWRADGQATAPVTPAPTAKPAGAAPSDGSTSSGPKQIGPVILDPQAVDFGIVAPGTTVKAEVKITNTLDRPITVTECKPSCQCTSVDIKGMVIPPGGSIPMPMSMVTAKSTGIKQAGVTLMFDAYEKPVVMSIRSEVAYSVRASPPFIDIQQTPPANDPKPGARPLRGVVTLSSTDGQPFRVLSWHGKPPFFVGYAPDQDEPRASYQIAYDYSKTPADQVSPYIIVETDRADCPVMDIRVRHEATKIALPFHAAEYRASIGEVKPGEKATFDLAIHKFEGRSVVSVLSRDPAQANVRLVDQKSDGTDHVIEVEVTPAAGRKGLLFFPMTIVTSDGKNGDVWIFGRVAG